MRIGNVKPLFKTGTRTIRHVGACVSKRYILCKMIHRLFNSATFFPSVDIADLSGTINNTLDFQEWRSNFRKMLILARKLLHIDNVGMSFRHRAGRLTDSSFRHKPGGRPTRHSGENRNLEEQGQPFASRFLPTQE